MTLAGQVWFDEAAGDGRPDARWEQAFEQAWPVVARRLRAVLRARKVPPCDWDDYLQEVAARMITTRLEFGRPEDVLPWATTVVRRLHLDQVRRTERLQQVERRMSSAPRRSPDVASNVLAKLDLDRVAEVVGSWSPFDRDALLVGDGADAGHARGSGASYVRRHRLRASLLRVIDGVAGVVAGIRRFHVRRAVQANQVVSIAMSPVALACAAFVFPFVTGPDAVEPARRAPVVDLASVARWTPAAAAGHDAAGHAAGRAAGAMAPARHASAAIPIGPIDQPMRWPAEYKVIVQGGGHTAGVELENNHDERPLFCSRDMPVIPDGCVDVPVERVDLPVEEPW